MLRLEALLCGTRACCTVMPHFFRFSLVSVALPLMRPASSLAAFTWEERKSGVEEEWLRRLESRGQLVAEHCRQDSRNGCRQPAGRLRVQAL